MHIVRFRAIFGQSIGLNEARPIRKDAKRASAELIVDEARGKGGHWVVRFRGHFTIVQSGEITPLMEKTIRKQLGL